MASPYDPEAAIRPPIATVRSTPPEWPGSNLRVDVHPGDHVRLLLPHSELCQRWHIAGHIWTVEVLHEGVQLINDEGRRWARPCSDLDVGIAGQGEHRWCYVVEPPPLTAARARLGSYARAGAAEAPGAAAFALIGLAADGQTNGDGAHVCRACAARVAADALAAMSRAPLPWHPEDGSWRAVIQCGQAPGYDLEQMGELLYDTFCAECEQLIVGNHVATCNGSVYIAGPRRGRACFCSEIERLRRLRGANVPPQLRNDRGLGFVEEQATAEASCDGCLGPIHVGEVRFRVPDRAGWTRCCRCTFVY